MHITCPKCQSATAHIEAEDTDIWIRCFCGYRKVIHTTLDSTMSIEHIDMEGKVTIPKKGSKLLECLAALVTLGKASTADIHDLISNRNGSTMTPAEVATFLTILRYRGLVQVVVLRKGISGGSIWEPTEEALELIFSKRR